MTDSMATSYGPIVGQVEEVKGPNPLDHRLWSSTSIIGVLDKPALVPWAAKKTAEAAVDKHKTWTRILESDGRDAAVEYLSKARFAGARGMPSAKQIGTEFHAAAQSYALTGTRPIVAEYVRPLVDQFDRFLQEFQPEYDAVEMVVYSPTYNYAGQTDGILRIDGTSFIIDYKTSMDPYDGRGNPKTPYDESALQLASYRWAEMAAIWRARRYEIFSRRYYLLSDEERAAGVPVPHVDRGLAIMITPAFYSVHEVRCDQVVHDHFLYLIEAARWRQEIAPNVVQPAMTPPHSNPFEHPDDPFEGLPA